MSSTAVPNYSSTSNRPPPNVPTPRTKILLLGLRRAGKTSIQQVLFNNLPPNQTFYLETTMRIVKHSIDTVIPLEIWDCPANTTVESLGVPLSQFSTIIFVIDIRDLYNQPISKLVEFIVASYAENPDIILEVFVHKAEKLQEDDKIENFRQIHERVSDRLLDMSPEYEQMQLNFHLTSVYDHSLHEAFSRVLHKLIDSLPYLEELLNVFCANSQSPKAFLFDTRSRLYIATDASPVDSATHNLCCDYLQMLNSFGPLYKSITATPNRQRQLTGESIPNTPPPSSSSSSSLSPRPTSTSASVSSSTSHSPVRPPPPTTNYRPPPPANGSSSGLLSPIPPTPPTPTTPRASAAVSPHGNGKGNGMRNGPPGSTTSSTDTPLLTPTLTSPMRPSNTSVNNSYFPPIPPSASALSSASAPGSASITTSPGPTSPASVPSPARTQTQTQKRKDLFYPSASTTLSSFSFSSSSNAANAHRSGNSNSHSATRSAPLLATAPSSSSSLSRPPPNGALSNTTTAASTTSTTVPSASNNTPGGGGSSNGTTTLTYHLITRHLALLALIPTAVYEERRGLVEYNVVFFREGVQEICDIEEEARASG